VWDTGVRKRKTGGRKQKTAISEEIKIENANPGFIISY